MWTRKTKSQRLEKQSSSSRRNEQAMGRGVRSQRSSWREEQAVTQTVLALSEGPGLSREQGTQPTTKTPTQRLLKCGFPSPNQQQLSFRRAVGLPALCHQPPPPQQETAFQGHGDGTPPWAWSSGQALMSFHNAAQFNPLSTKRTVCQVLDFVWFPRIPLQKSSYFLSPCSQTRGRRRVFRHLVLMQNQPLFS